MPALYVLILIPILFYVVIPLAGAFQVRTVWRRFRLTMVNASFFPLCDYDDIMAKKREGYYRFFGEIETIQQNGLLWVKNEQITMTARMENCHVYLIPSEKKMNSQMPTKLRWNRVFSIAEGTDVYICGNISESNGRLQFQGSRKEPLTVILYDGEKKTLLERSISCGRQKNEYWNFLTPWSVAIGGILSLVLLNMMIQANVNVQFLIGGIIVAALPIIPFLPPGLFFFLLYTVLWRRGRYCRADRDLLALPLRFEDKNIKTLSYLHQKFSSGKALHPVREGFKKRSFRLGKKNNKSLWNYSVFGSLHNSDEGRWLKEPEDPMKEFILIDGDPSDLVKSATRKAQRYEALSMISILFSLLLNIILMILIINQL